MNCRVAFPLRRRRAFRSPDDSRSSTRLSTTVKILSALAIAGWTLWLYWSFGAAQQALTNEQLRLENILKRSAIIQAAQPKIDLSHDLSVETVTGRAHLYEAYFSLKIKNTSQTRVEISWAVYEWYLGQLPNVIANPTVLEINAPPKLELTIVEKGPMAWASCGRHAFTYRNTTYPNVIAMRAKPYFQMGGGPTKSLASGAEAEYTMPFLIEADQTRWLGVVVIIGIDGAQPNSNTGPNLFYVSDWFALRSAEKSSG